MKVTFCRNPECRMTREKFYLLLNCCKTQNEVADLFLEATIHNEDNAAMAGIFSKKIDKLLR